MGDSSAFAVWRHTIPLSHSLEEDRLKAAVMDQNWVLDFHQFGQELPPDAALVRRTVGPKAVLNDRVARFDSNANQVVEVSVGQTLDIHINRCASEAGGQDGVLIRVDPDRKVSSWRRSVGISNTLAWSPDRRRFYLGDSLRNVVWVYDYDFSIGKISNERPFLEGFAAGVADGSTVDAEGYLWNCRFFGNCIVRVAPNGKIARVIEMPAQNITRCTFGGADLTTLYVASASAEAPRGDRLAGSLFAIQTKIKGQPENCFRFFDHK
jgi:hypothetical protein